MENTILQALVAALCGGLVNLLFWYGFNRREARRDKEVGDLQSEVKTLRDEKIRTIEDRLTKDHEAHGQLHEKINKLPASFITRGECALLCGDSMQRIEKAIGLHSAQIQEVRDDAVATKTIVELIAQHMNISVGRKTHEPN